jgi:MFS family permease
MSHAAEANVWKSYLFGFLMDCSLTAPVWVLYLRDERGFSLTQITLMEVPLFLLIVFAEVPTGAVADRFGRKVSLMLASAIMAVSMFVYGIATNYWVVLVANLTWGLAFTFRSGADTALLYDSLKEAGREPDFQRANARFWAVRFAAMLTGLLLGAAIAGETRYSVAVTLSALVSACALPVAWFLHEPAHVRAPAREPYLRTLVGGVREAWRAPALRYLFLFSGVVGAGAAGPLLLLLQPWLVAHGIDTAQLGLWQAPMSAVGALAALAATRLLVGVGELRAFWTLPVLLSACGCVLAALDHVGAAAAFLGIAFVRGAHEPLLASAVNRRVESERRATVLSVQNMVGNVGMAAVWPLAGLAADAYGLGAVFALYAAGAAVLGGGALLLYGSARAG